MESLAMPDLNIMPVNEINQKKEENDDIENFDISDDEEETKDYNKTITMEVNKKKMNDIFDKKKVEPKPKPKPKQVLKQSNKEIERLRKLQEKELKKIQKMEEREAKKLERQKIKEEKEKLKQLKLRQKKSKPVKIPPKKDIVEKAKEERQESKPKLTKEEIAELFKAFQVAQNHFIQKQEKPKPQPKPAPIRINLRENTKTYKKYNNPFSIF